mgnify:CR=1 FL=1
MAADSATPMRVFKITNKQDSLLLRTPSEHVNVDPKDTVLMNLINRMYATVRDSLSLGAGIAAPQVGILKNIAWVQRFDKEGFPDPKGLNDYLHDKDFKSVYMIDPGVKQDSLYTIYQQGTAGDHWVQTAGGKEFNGEVWPGQVAFPDYTQPRTQKWWA